VGEKIKNKNKREVIFTEQQSIIICGEKGFYTRVLYCRAEIDSAAVRLGL